jgi:hypothetical protein
LRRIVVIGVGLVGILLGGAHGPIDAIHAEGAEVSRMWLELDPSRFESQPTVTRILWLRELAEAMPPDRAHADVRARRSVQFSQASPDWHRQVLVQAPRPEVFQPAALQTVVDLGGPGRLFWTAAEPEQPQSLLDMLGDLEQIWGEGMQAAVADYATAFGMLGRFRHAAAEVREEKGRLTGRLLLVAASEGDAKRASGALALARALGGMVTATAVQSGGMTPEEAAALDAVLGSIETRVDGSRLTIHLGIDVVTLQAVLE